MTLQTPSLPTGVRNQNRKWLVLAAGGAGLLLAAAAGIGVRQATDEAHSPATAVEQAATAQAPSTVTTPWYMRYGDGPTWYLVASQQQADETAEAISYRNQTLLLEGKPLPNEQVVVVNNPLAQQAINFAAADERAYLTVRGETGVTVIDLRPASGGK